MVTLLLPSEGSSYVKYRFGSGEYICWSHSRAELETLLSRYRRRILRAFLQGLLVVSVCNAAIVLAHIYYGPLPQYSAHIWLVASAILALLVFTAAYRKPARQLAGFVVDGRAVKLDLLRASSFYNRYYHRIQECKHADGSIEDALYDALVSQVYLIVKEYNMYVRKGLPDGWIDQMNDFEHECSLTMQEKIAAHTPARDTQ